MLIENKRQFTAEYVFISFVLQILFLEYIKLSKLIKLVKFIIDKARDERSKK